MLAVCSDYTVGGGGVRAADLPVPVSTDAEVIANAPYTWQGRRRFPFGQGSAGAPLLRAFLTELVLIRCKPHATA